MTDSWKGMCMSCTVYLTPTLKTVDISKPLLHCDGCQKALVKKCTNYRDRACFVKCDACERFACLDCKPIPVWVERSYHLCKRCFFAGINKDIFVHAPTIKAIFAEQEQHKKDEKQVVPIAEFI